MFSPRFVATCLAAAFLNGAWSERALRARGRRLFDYFHARGLRDVVERVLATFPDRGAVGLDALTEFLLADVPRRWAAYGLRPRVSSFKPAMQPTPEVSRGWNLPAIASPAQLADWLGLTLPQLDWFADVRRLNYRVAPGRLWHYTYHVVRKASGRIRLLEAPKAKLKAIQRHILRDLLSRVPPHAAAHGFRPGRSVVTYAAPHTGKQMVLRLDLKDFFASVSATRVRALFRKLGYPREVAHFLTGLCTHATPDDAWPADTSPEDWLTRRRFADRHLPQGAPTSPALANLCAFRLDVRLTALAAVAGAVYTRYADDLAFSGGAELARGASRFRIAVGKIVAAEGFEVNWKKTRRMRPSARQHLAGVVVNVRPNVCRRAYDQLKAILHNCRWHGPQAQNRGGVPDFHAHLLGKVAHLAAIHPGHGHKLRTIFDTIDWNSPPNQ